MSGTINGQGEKGIFFEFLKVNFSSRDLNFSLIVKIQFMIVGYKKFLFGPRRLESLLALDGIFLHIGTTRWSMYHVHPQLFATSHCNWAKKKINSHLNF